ncbi:MAG: hypothetical protein QOC95_2783, partial [Thermoleophilaceae bacterium]|nr:hypothetical protein [Thermoleophilaceae bacterium]
AVAEPGPELDPAAAAVRERPPVAQALVAGAGGAAATLPPPPTRSGGNGHGGFEADTAVLDSPSGSVTADDWRTLPPPAAGHSPPPPPPPPRRRVPPGLARSGRPVLALLTLLVAGLCAWSIWQPLRSDQQSDHALDLAAVNRTDAARAAARRAHDLDPLSPRPYVILNAVEDAAGNRAAALRALQQAVIEFPADPQTWIQLAQYQLNSLNRPTDALNTIAGALYLDPQSRAAQTVFFQATTVPPGAAPTVPPATATPPASVPPATPVPTAPAPPAPAPSAANTGGTKAPGRK